jgi:hypothetical protein
MGRRITQKTYECSLCGRIPYDGEYLWEMAGEYHCEDCIKTEEAEDKQDE